MQQRHHRRLRFLLQIREIHKPTDRRLIHRRRPALRTLAPVERRHQSPVMPLTNLPRQRMIMTLRTIQPRPVNHRRNRLRHLLMLRLPLIQKPLRSLRLLTIRPPDNNLPQHLRPRPIRIERTLQIRMPPMLRTLPRLPIPASPHQHHIPQLPHRPPILRRRQPLRNQRLPLVRSIRPHKRLLHLRRRQYPSQIQPHAPHKCPVVTLRCRFNPARTPARLNEMINRHRRILRHRSSHRRNHRLCLLRRSQCHNPLPHRLPLRLTHLLLRRHVRLRPSRQIQIHPALLGLPRHHRRPLIPTLQNPLHRVHLQPALLLNRPMTLHTLLIHHRPNMRLPQRLRLPSPHPSSHQHTQRHHQRN